VTADGWRERLVLRHAAPGHAEWRVHQLILTGDTSGQTAILPVLVPTPPTAPAFTQDTPPTTAAQGSQYDYEFGTLSDPTPTFSLTADAPDWLTIDPVLGILTGNPPPGTTSFTYSVIADN